jgi:DNA-binding XRE family transcriptional regulator
MGAQTIQLDGKSYVVLERGEYDRLTTLAKAADLPALPEPDADGNYPALEYTRATIARRIIRERVEVGLSQRQLAQRAGIRVETLCRIETAKHTPSIATYKKIEQALRAARKPSRATPSRRRRARRPGRPNRH